MVVPGLGDDRKWLRPEMMKKKQFIELMRKSLDFAPAQEYTDNRNRRRRVVFPDICVPESCAWWKPAHQNREEWTPEGELKDSR